MRGGVTLYPGTIWETFVPNLITNEGEDTFLKMIARASVAEVASGGNFYVGLCGGASIDEADALTDISDEPTSAGGYARIAVTRDATGFPTIDSVNGFGRAVSKLCTFAASGANFSRTVQRAFLCNVASGTSGLLFGYTGLFPSAVQVNDGESLPLQYNLFAS